MALFGKSGVKQSDVVKHRSTLGFLLNPDIGASISPLRDTVRMFVNLLAMIFAASGMFPRNHPAFTNDAIHLSLPEVMGTAWKSLKPTPGNVPRYLLFFGVLSGIIFGAVAIFVVVASLLIGHAHAQTPTGTTTNDTGTINSSNSFFSPVDSTQDIALAWINFLFKGQAVYNYLSGAGQILPQMTTVQAGLMKILAFYSDAVLVVAAFMLFYYLTTMIISTAHHGEVMGKKADKVWAPIRLVIALGMLVPISGGLSSGQMILIQFVEWGSNLASQTWSMFVTSLSAQDQVTTSNVAPDSTRVVYDSIMSEACIEAYQAYYNGLNGGGASTTSDANCPGTVANLSGTQYTIQWHFNQLPTASGNGPRSYNVQLMSGGTPAQVLKMCGGYLYTGFDGSDTVGGEISQVRQSAFEGTLQPAVQGFVKKYISNFVCAGVGGSEGQTTTSTGIPQDMVEQQIVQPYENTLVAQFQSQVINANVGQTHATGQAGGAGQNGNSVSAMQQIANVSAAQGWVGAGSWLNTIARLQGEYARVTEAMPATRGPDLDTEYNDEIFNKHVRPTLVAFQQWLNATMPRDSTGAGTQSVANGVGTSNYVQVFSLEKQGISEENGGGHNNLMDRLFSVVDWLAGKNGVWNPVISTADGALPTLDTSGNGQYSSGQKAIKSGDVIGIQFTSADPLAQISAFGHRNLNTAYAIFDLMFDIMAYVKTIAAGTKFTADAVKNMTQKIPLLNGVTSLLTTFVSGGAQTMDALATSVMPILGTVSLVFFTCGFMLAYFLPLIPFLKFFFNTLTWFIALLEAIIAIPLIALAHLNPEGEGLPGSAKTAYGMIFSIFLRPVMMVFGLILGLLVFSIAAGLLNLLYALAVAGTGGIAHTGHLFLSRIIYTAIYVFMLYMAGNSCFKMIEYLPEQAVDWMGLKGVQFREFGNIDQVQQPMQFISSYADSQFIQGIQKLGPMALPVKNFLDKGANTIPKQLGTMGDQFVQLAQAAGLGPQAQQLVKAAGGSAEKLDTAVNQLPANNPLRQAWNTIKNAGGGASSPPVGTLPRLAAGTSSQQPSGQKK